MENIASFLEKSLREHDVRASVSVEEDPSMGPGVVNVHVRKDIGPEPLVYSYQITDTHRNNIEKRLANSAGRIANQFRNHLVSVYKWDNRSIKITPYAGGSIKCNICNTEVDVCDTLRSSLVTNVAEMSSPQPVPYNTHEWVDSLSDEKRMILELYCIGELREQCDMHCPNSKHSSTSMHPKYDLAVTADD